MNLADLDLGLDLDALKLKRFSGKTLLAIELLLHRFKKGGLIINK